MANGRETTDPLVLWRAIVQAGGADAYVHQELERRGFLIKRKPTDSMSKAELKRYKKQLKQEAAEKKTLKKEAWEAYKAAHIVHLGDVFWHDGFDYDKWDLPEPEARAPRTSSPGSTRSPSWPRPSA